MAADLSKNPSKKNLAGSKRRCLSSWLPLSLGLWSGRSWAADSFTYISTMNDVFEMLHTHETEILRLIAATGYIIGFFLVLGALFHLKKIGRTMGTMMSGQESMFSPMVKAATGVMLIYLPSTLDIGLQTIWGSEASILSYSADTLDSFAGLKEGLITLMRIIGYITLIRGLVILSRSGSGHASPQNGGVGKGIINIMGGILAINIVGTIRLVGSILGLDLI